jgi:DnaJ-class molecular chaperone
MVLKHWGVPEFNPPDETDIYDLEQLRGDHIVKFKVLLPNLEKVSKEERTILEQILAAEKANSETFYKDYR